MMAVKSACCEPCVLVLGYSMHLEGGVSKVTALLIDNMPELTLHPILFSYNSLKLIMNFLKQNKDLKITI